MPTTILQTAGEKNMKSQSSKGLYTLKKKAKISIYIKNTFLHRFSCNFFISNFAHYYNRKNSSSMWLVEHKSDTKIPVIFIHEIMNINLSPILYLIPFYFFTGKIRNTEPS